MSPKQWVSDPNSGGIKIKEDVKRRTKERIIKYAESIQSGVILSLIFAFEISSVMLMPTQNQNYLVMTGHHLVFKKLVKSIWNDYETLHITFLDFDILEMKKNGGYPFIVIRMKNMNYQFFLQVNFLVRLKPHLKHRPNFIFNYEKGIIIICTWTSKSGRYCSEFC